MIVRLEPQAFEPLTVIAEVQQNLGDELRRIGAAAFFVGSMREFNDGSAVESMVLEHYPGMTEQHMENIAREAAERWQLDEVLIVHRTGEVRPADPIVLVAVWSAHRAHAFESCRHIMEDLKSRAPLWKKERSAEGDRWVSNNTPGTSDAFPSADQRR